jgi:uncharacterized Ntn-hydrolase superfamily protein
MTYSIVARDPSTGELGVAVQSKYFSVGSVVCWAEPGVGAVATQATADISYGPLGLDLMRGGKRAPETLRALLATDEDRDQRQIAMVDAHGSVATHTGVGCIAEAGHQAGDGYSCQANIMLNDTVWAAMAAAYQSSEEALPERLLTTLDAAETEGGDARGRQSAALLVVPAEGPRWDKVVELRVEDHPQPLVELRRLLELKRTHQRYNAVVARLLTGETEALTEIEAFTGDIEFEFTRALALAAWGRLEEARHLYQDVCAREPGWKDMPARYAAASIIPTSVAELLQ